MKHLERKSYKVRTVLGLETKFTGTLCYNDSLKIDGRFEGSIETPGFLMVETTAVVVADIKSGTLVVSGSIKGDVHVEKRLELLRGGKIIGNVRCPCLIMEDDTSIQGRCEMLADSFEIDIFSMSRERLKKTAARV